MATPRTIIAAQFDADHDYKVYAFPYFPSQVNDPIIAVWRTNIGDHPTSPKYLRHSIEIQALVGPSLEEKAEAAADDLIDAVLTSLQRIEGVAGVTSERTVFGNPEKGEFQGWLVKCHVDSENVYASKILEERA